MPLWEQSLLATRPVKAAHNHRLLDRAKLVNGGRQMIRVPVSRAYARSHKDPAQLKVIRVAGCLLNTIESPSGVKAHIGV